jgi:RND superfamily putative drug exporter
MIDRWGAFVARRALAVLLAGMALAVAAAGYGLGVFDSLSQGGFDDAGSESARELALEQDTFGNKSPDIVAIYSSDDLTADDPAFRRQVEDVVGGIPPAAVSSVLTSYSTGDPTMVSEDGHAVQVVVSLAGKGQDALLRNYDKVAPTLEADGLHTDLAGSFAVYNDVNEITSEDLARAETMSMPIVVLLALLIFGSLVAASMPALVGLLAMVGALALVRVLTGFTEVSVFSVNVISLLGIGLAIDYALFVISRFREELAQLPADDTEAAATAIRTTMNTAGRTVLFSGLTVAAAMSSLLIFPQAFLRSMGYGGIAAVLVAMLAALTVLPATLRLLGRRVDAGRLPWRRRRPVAVEPENGRWARLARGVMRRPVAVIAVTVVGLLAIASPFLGARWGSVDYRVLPDDAPAHVAAQRLNDEFGAEESSASLLVRHASAADVAAYVDEVEQVDGITSVQQVDTQGDVTLLRAVWQGNSQTDRSQDVVRELRAIDPPAGTALVGGLTADTVDLVSSVSSHLPWMGLIVVAVMLVLLFIAFGSLVLPVKAVVMNLFSITASFGVITWIFSDGHLSGLLGFTPQGYLDATNPILMLAILFGLSMDYEVFLVSRMHEEWVHTGDARYAVRHGLAMTGRVVTAAAVIMIAVFGAFAIGNERALAMMGVGFASAIFIDAFIIRLLLLPAVMHLAGPAMWWIPSWLDKRLPHFHIERPDDEAPEPEPERELAYR